MCMCVCVYVKDLSYIADIVTEHKYCCCQLYEAYQSPTSDDIIIPQWIQLNILKANTVMLCWS